MFLILVALIIAVPHIILGSSESMIKQLAISSSVLFHFWANSFCCVISGMVFSCRMRASKQYILICHEGNSSHYLGSASCASPHWEQISSGWPVLTCLPQAGPQTQNSCSSLQTQCATGTLTMTLLWKVSSNLWTLNTLSNFFLLWSLPLLVLEFLWSWPMRTHCKRHRAPILSPVHFWPHLFDLNDPIIRAISLHSKVLRCWNSSWTLQQGEVSKSSYFLVLVLHEVRSVLQIGNSVLFLCRSAASLSVDTSCFEQEKICEVKRY